MPAWSIPSWSAVFWQTGTSLRLQHTETVRASDTSRGLARGLTMWCADNNGQTPAAIGLAWEWLEISPRVVVMADQMTVVSNLYPIDGRGLLMSDSQRLLALCELIWALPWQRKIRAALVAERADTAAVA